tara:strand:- start:2917 stop:3543 length:627 start_codon:yes stop_codon:yes gene_type:complete
MMQCNQENDLSKLTKTLKKSESVDLPTEYGKFKFMCYTDRLTTKEHLVLIHGDIQTCEAPYVRVHSECVTGDIFSSLKCDCGAQLNHAMSLITQEDAGMIIYLKQEGRGIGIENKIKAYQLQEQGYDTVEANEQLGFAADLRSYDIAAYILADHHVTSVRLLTNNPKKVAGLEKHNIKVIERKPIRITSNKYNQNYLMIKKEKLNHYF